MFSITNRHSTVFCEDKAMSSSFHFEFQLNSILLEGVYTHHVLEKDNG